MLDFSHIPSQYPNADVQVFVGHNQNASGAQWVAWQKPRGKAMCHILLVGVGGNGGNGVVGANSFAGGGGGGGSGGQTSIRFPLWAVPDTLFVSTAGQAGNGSYVATSTTSSTTNNTLIAAQSGGNGGNGTTVPAGGAAGGAAGVVGGSLMALGWQWLQQALAGQAGQVAGAAGSGGAVVLPTTGLFVTGGGGGAGLGATGSVGSAGGAITGAGVFPTLPTYSVSSGTPTLSGALGPSGMPPIPNLVYNYGGCGGGASTGSATGDGLFGGNGGNGAPGCGGGGGGACLTGGVAGVGGKGGPAFCIITCW